MKDKDCLKYKGFIGSIEYSIEDKRFFGKVLNSDSIIIYGGNTLEELHDDFKEMIDFHIKECEKDGSDPFVSFKGNLNVRIDPSIHKEANNRSKALGISLNKYINMALTAFVYNESAYTKNRKRD